VRPKGSCNHTQGTADWFILSSDLNAVSPSQRPLVSAYYRGSIPTLALFNFRGELLYDGAGETAIPRANSAALETLLRSALAPPHDH
jgi:hypothetical protein